MPAGSDLRLYRSNSLEVLAGLLADELRTPAPGQALLAPDTILVPQVAMRRWLQAALADAHGIAANLEFLTPGEFVGRALAANVPAPPGEDALDAETLRWHLYAALTDRALLSTPALAAIAAHVGGEDPLRAWSLSGELAATFEKYQAWRRDWLLRWEAGSDPDDPQAILWRTVATGRAHRARRIQAYLARFGEGDAVPAGLPSRLFAFATLNVSPDVLRVLATQARAGTLHFYLPTPTQAYWGAGDGDADGSPLLRDWGMAGRDFMALLGSYEAVHPSGEIAAFAEPVAADAPATLLRRMQADLFHDRAPGRESRLAAVDPGDPSLQAHACHTRLRELQVLHDRLRALLEDERFDPPLQPREIAVLAPDIDPYVPYLDAVFGGHGEPAARAIPWAVADASPLAGEPLAAAFLQLLALPVSRLGLDETLDLLASPPLAEASGLDAASLERLHAWLREAGARWGLDAAHRARHGAPEDDAYTWQFALDRLLLGHATGDTHEVAGDAARVAPWPDLEGGALEALDVLLRLLRVLAAHERALGEAMPPARWRDRLLGLLDALLPRPPATREGERALERLRMLVDAFATDAGRAGYDAPVPPEVVRAHFAAVLGEADTRAPLLTGGVSFARMVPMRLLPFRVICLLGMNDGEFPRRDPAAGLNRLTAELGTDRRRHGDRSTRDDDRFLFLQLFAAAQDVFYVSWIGADARDGSRREPSAVVTELLAAAADQHVAADPEALVLRHPLQPFSPAAFGSEDPRHFSYRAPWHRGAARLSGTRAALAPWLDRDAPLAAQEAAGELALDALCRFLLSPCEQFLRQRLGLRLPEVEEAPDDVEPLEAPGHGLARHRLQHAVFAGLVDGLAPDAMQASLRARGLLPSGPLGRRALGDVLREVRPYADGFRGWRGDAAVALAPLPVEVEIEGLRLHSRLGGLWPAGAARLRFGAPTGPSVIRHGLDWLLACAADAPVRIVEFHEDREHGFGPHPRRRIEPAQAKDALRVLLALRAKGLREPLPFGPRSGFKFHAAKTVEAGVRAASAQWRGGDRAWGECGMPGYELALRARDPFTDPAALREFVDIANTVFAAVCEGISVPPGLDEDALARVVLDGDDEA